MTGREILIYLSVINEGNWNKIYQDIKNRRKDFSENDIICAIDGIKSKAVTIIDDEYPNFLKNVNKPPFVLYYYGDLNIVSDDRKCISVIGSRKNTEYGKEMTIELVKELAKYFVIVSGLAKGIDSIANETAITVNGKTVAILGCGIDYCYPNENRPLYEKIKENHLLISEYPGMTPPSKERFPERNRLIAYFSKTLLLVEGSVHSGSYITVSYALMKGSDICCVPFLAGRNSACNRLIKEGAKLVETAQDIYDEINFSPTKYCLESKNS